MKIHPTASVSPAANLGSDVEIGPFCVIEAGVTLGDRCKLESHVTVKQGTTLGCDNYLCEGAVLGGLPQHVRRPERPGTLAIGSHNVFREYVTLHRALEAGAATTIGDANLLMINAHVAHDCRVGSRVIVANNVMLAGHVTVEDRAYLSGAVGIHQFCRVGTLAMLGGQARIVKDVPPYVTVDGGSSLIVGLNLVGLRRAGFTAEQIAEIKAAYRLIYRQELTWTKVVERLGREFTSGPAARFHEFFQGGKRGFTPERRGPSSATLRLLDPVEEPATLRARAG